MMTTFLWALVAAPVAVGLYAYIGYPLVLKMLWGRRMQLVSQPVTGNVPMVSICLPVYNEEAALRTKLVDLVALDYPKDRLQILVVSDASTDGTDSIVQDFADHGVELLRVEQRAGKTAAENAAIPHLRGDIVVNTDATIRIPPEALRPLVQALDDPTVGVASGRDVSVGDEKTAANRGESGYVGYEMQVRELETAAGSIVGASGCYYAIRRDLHAKPIPAELSRDFASALTAKENGFRAVSVHDAVCFVPRTGSLAVEFRRKVRTMARGLDTLFFKRHLLNPFRHGRFAFMLFSHKLCRWLVPLLLPLSLVGLVLLAPRSNLAIVLLGLVAAGCVLGLVAARWPGNRNMPKPVAAWGYLMSSNLAGILAWFSAVRGKKNPFWEPTRRRVAR